MPRCGSAGGCRCGTRAGRARHLLAASRQRQPRGLARQVRLRLALGPFRARARPGCRPSPTPWSAGPPPPTSRRPSRSTSTARSSWATTDGQGVYHRAGTGHAAAAGGGHEPTVRLAVVGDLHVGRPTSGQSSVAAAAAERHRRARALRRPHRSRHGRRGAAAREGADGRRRAGGRGARQPRLRGRAGGGDRADARPTPGSTCSTASMVEVHGVGFAGVKGFCGGFGRGALGPWGEHGGQGVRAGGGERGAEARTGAGAAAHAAQGRAAALLADPRDRRGRAARDLPVSRLEPARGAARPATPSTSSSTDTRTTASSPGAPRRASRSATSRCRCSAS